MAHSYLKAGYALTGRSQCKGCWENIEKGIFRIAYCEAQEHYHNNKWYHLDCVPQKVKKLNIDQIAGYDTISNYVKSKISRKHKNVLKAFQYIGKEQIAQKEAQARLAFKEEMLKLEQIKTEQIKSESLKNDVIKNQYIKNEFIKKENGQSVTIISDEEDMENKLKKIVKEHNDYFGSQTTIQKSNEIPLQIPDKVLDDMDQQYSIYMKPNGYTDLEWTICRQYLRQMQNNSIQKLKELLLKNNQPLTGIKSELLMRVADCMTLGAIPQCPTCKKGRPIFYKETGFYRCPGYIDNDNDLYYQCKTIFSKELIQRKQWIYQ